MSNVHRMVGFGFLLCLVGALNAQEPKVDAAKIGRARADVATLKMALNQFRLDCDRYPTTKEGLLGLQQCQPGLEKKWRGPYLSKKCAPDPWGRPYVYLAKSPKGKKGFSVLSYGADGKPGGKGINADIVEGSD